MAERAMEIEKVRIGIVDAEWAPVNEAAALLLTRFSEAVQRQHGSNLASVRLDGK